MKKVQIQPLFLTGSDASLITLKTENGISAQVMTPGAALFGYFLPDRTGKLQNVVLSLADKARYFDNPFYAGAVLAPNAGRLQNAALPIGKRQYRLAANDGQNNLHGGPNCASFQNWTADETWRSDEAAGVRLSLLLSDGLDGFPGRRMLTASYTLSEDGTLSFCCQAQTDAVTYMNISHHTYFNLTGDFTQTALEQELEIAADRYIANDASHLPYAVKPAASTAFDYQKSGTPKSRMEKWPEDAQLKNALGYNNGFVLHASCREPAAVLTDPCSGRQLSLFTDAPCLVLYSGGYLAGGPDILTADDTSVSHGRAVPPTASCALALEAQDFPDAVQNPLFHCRLLKPGETFSRSITWKPSVPCPYFFPNSLR